MTRAYVYKWTHLPTMKYYVGSRTAKKCHPDDGYICSSREVKSLIVEHPEEWTRTIVAVGSPEEMYQLETEILQLFDCKHDSRSFNKHNNIWLGFAGGEKHPMFGTKRPEHAKKMSGKPSGNSGKKITEETRNRMSKAQSGTNNSMYGKTHSEETIKKITESRNANPIRHCTKIVQCQHCGAEVLARGLGSHIHHKHK